VQRVYAPAQFPLNHIWYNIAVWWRVRKLPADVIDICAPFGFLVALFDRRPIITKLHSLYRVQPGNLLYRLVYFRIAALFDDIFVARSGFVMTTSGFMNAEIRQQWHLPADRVVTIPNGVSDFWFEESLDRSAARATGEGSDYGEEITEAIEKYNLADSVKIMDWQDRERLRAYYSAADVFVHPATYEPFGNVTLGAWVRTP
jgi:glycosyltransferase involved in cell wall biosynthesis